jgi:hypothetical protein
MEGRLFPDTKYREKEHVFELMDGDQEITQILAYASISNNQ